MYCGIFERDFCFVHFASLYFADYAHSAIVIPRESLPSDVSKSLHEEDEDALDDDEDGGERSTDRIDEVFPLFTDTCVTTQWVEWKGN